jgi:DNA-binding NtrC family response regulator
MLSKVGGSRNPVMIVGENGTGKELVARSIHSNGPDNSKPFVSIDCKSMSSESLETALFGMLDNASNEEGIERRGLLSAPEGGTVFLDEVGGLTLDLQAKLVRGLREKKIGPQGHPLSARILAATSHDLTRMVNEGRFRFDLFGLLSIVNLKIPPLRGRPDDITFLAERFLRKIGCGNGIAQTIPQETLRALKTYDWPENTRELESAISQACIRSSGAELEIHHLPQNILTFCRTKEAEQKRDLVPVGNPATQTLEESVIPMAIMEKRAILMALQQTKGDKIVAARLLGIGKTTLYRKLKEYSVYFEPESNLPIDSHLDSTPTANISQMI